MLTPLLQYGKPKQAGGLHPLVLLIAGMLLLGAGFTLGRSNTSATVEYSVGASVEPSVGASVEPSVGASVETSVGGTAAEGKEKVQTNWKGKDGKGKEHFLDKCAKTKPDLKEPEIKANKDECEKIWTAIDKAITEWKPETEEKTNVPNWETLLPSALIGNFLMGDSEVPSRKNLMLWTGDWRYDDAWREAHDLYRLELTALGRAMGEVLGDANFKGDDKYYCAFVGGIYDTMSSTFVKAYEGSMVFVGLSKAITHEQYLMKTFARAELANVLTNTNIKTMLVYSRSSGGPRKSDGTYDPPKPEYEKPHPDSMKTWYNTKDTAPTEKPSPPNVDVDSKPVNPMVFQAGTDSWKACYVNNALKKTLEVDLPKPFCEGGNKADSSVEEGTAVQSGDRQAISLS